MNLGKTCHKGRNGWSSFGCVQQYSRICAKVETMGSNVSLHAVTGSQIRSALVNKARGEGRSLLLGIMGGQAAGAVQKHEPIRA